MNSALLMQKLVFIAPIVARLVLYVLIGLSVLSFGLIIERWWYFRRRRDDLPRLAGKLKLALSRADFAAATEHLSTSRSVEARIVAEALESYGDGADAVEQILAKSVRLKRNEFEAGLLFLGTLGNNAPFIGLFGTVLGIVTAFRELGSNQSGAGMGNVMGGIAEALLATAVGILVALPAVIFYNIFQKKGADIEENAAALGNVLVASLRAVKDPHRSAVRSGSLSDDDAPSAGVERVPEIEA